MKSLWRDLQAHWRGSLPQRAVTAWRAELLGMVPARFRPAGAQQHLHWPLPESLNAPAQPVTLLLPRQQVLLRTFSLPVAAVRNLREVVRFELDKYTPYQPDEVAFDCRVLESGREQAQVQLAVIRRDTLGEVVVNCHQRRVALQGVDLCDPQAQPLGFNLLPEAQRSGNTDASRTLKGVLALVCLGLLLLLMALWLQARQQQLAVAQQTVDAQRQQAREIDALRQQLQRGQASAHWVAARKRAHPPLSALLADLSHCLPPGAWLESLEVNEEGVISLSGQSQNASALIGALRGCTTLADPRFQGVIQPDAATGKEHFALSARLVKEKQ